MKKSRHSLALSSLVATVAFVLLSSCGGKALNNNTYDEMISIKDDVISFSDDYRKHVIVEIDEASINNGVAIVNITHPDLIVAFENAMPKGNDSNEKLFEEAIINFEKYTATGQISAAVIQNKGEWEIQSSREIDDYLMQKIDEFLLHYLLQTDFSDINFLDIEWEVSE